MFNKTVKYYVLTNYNAYYEAKFIRSQRYDDKRQIHTFRTRDGDIHMLDNQQWFGNFGFVTTHRDEIMLEMGKRLYRGQRGIRRSPRTAGQILEWCIERYPHKLL